ncbi:catabolite repression protein creC [Mycena floridula]|nr:catabolite repression protein creC [Mycena floridula]
MENDSTFVAPEGVYTVTEEHKLPTIGPAVLSGPSLFPTRVSTVVVRYTAKASAPIFSTLLVVSNKDKKPKDDNVSLSSSDTPDEGDPGAPSTQDNHTGPSQEPHQLFSHPPTAQGKKKTPARPKHNIRTTSSTFITRIQNAEGGVKALQSKQGETTFIFYNSAKSFLWVEAGSKSKEPLTRVTFSSFPTCHDVNQNTATSERLDIVIGFSTGDLIWFDPISSRYARLNKQGCISSSACTAVRWVPSSTSLFLVSHADGTVIVYDKERSDGTFVPQDPVGATDSEDGTSQKEWDPLENIFVTMPPWHPVAGAPGKPDKDKAIKNPVSHWRVSRRSIIDFVFSPDVKYVAAISEDGCLRVIDALAEQLVDCFASYFGALTCVAWSPDGRFILTGGQDDLLTIFSPWEQRVVARCQGHSSFVSAVAFDDLRCDGRTYRFGSVGEDNKLILWDFSSGALHRPKLQPTNNQRVSMSSTISLALRRSALYLPAPDSELANPSRYHPAPSRNEIAVVQPVLMKHLENDLPTVIVFLSRSILTATKSGHIKLWIRPLALKNRKNHRPMADIHDLMNIQIQT